MSEKMDIDANPKKDEDIKKEFQQNVIINCKFEGVFEADKNKSLLEDYKNLVNLCRNKINEFEEISFSKEETKNIFYINDDMIDSCKANEELSFFEITLNYKINGNIGRKIIELKKNEYIFTYEEIKYYCFIIKSMKEYLESLFKKHEFDIEILEIPPPNNIFKDIEFFLISNYTEFKILIRYQFKDSDYINIDYTNVYKKLDKISGSELNIKLGLYIALSEDDFKGFKYYLTNERKDFFKKINGILTIKKVLGLCGPYGTGKTVTLLRLLILKENYKFFYINLATVNNIFIDELKKLLKYESTKLFDFNIISGISDSPQKNIYNSICNLINKYDGKNIFELLINIINMRKTLNDIRTCFVIDQYSSKYNVDKFWIEQLIKTAGDNIHLIICSSMNNDSVKIDLCNSLNEIVVFPSFQPDFIFYFYVGSLIRLNNLKEYKDIVKNESQELIKYLNFFGNIPLYYYSLKRTENEGRKLTYFVEKEKENITYEIKKFYLGNQVNSQDSSLQMFLDILKIISYINENEIFFFKELKEELLGLPLKFLEIKKEEISLKDLKLYGIITKNKKILDFIERKEENKSVENFIYENVITTNFTLFFNNKNYCLNYLSNTPKKEIENEKEKTQLIPPYYNVKEKVELYDKTVTIFYLEYLFPLMEDIFSNIDYKILLETVKYIYNLLSPQSKGGLLELIINQKVKNEKKFICYNIDDFEMIENFVPNDFFIQNYISRKVDTKRTFIENKNEIPNKMKKLKGNIFINQLQFTGKYYDCALLIQMDNYGGYKSLFLQISKKKVMSQRFYREEHAIIMNRVKSKLEKEYDIIIKEAHFSYILTDEERDEDTINFCEQNKLNYILFSVKELKFTQGIIPLFTDKTLITKIFPIHTAFSILPKEYFKTSKGILNNNGYIYDIQNKFTYENLSKRLFETVNGYFKTIQPLSENDKNEFVILGHFDEMFEVKKSFCIWLNNEDLFFYSFDANFKYLKYELKYSKRLAKTKYSLIVSKYKIFSDEE